MEKQSLNFGGSVSQNYEQYLGEFIFEPFAADLANRLDFNNAGDVLELACGSGRLTRNITEVLPAGVNFTATDLSPDMISVARTMVPSEAVKWVQADMQNLPFDDESFDLVVCQFGIMLVPDQLQALREIERVLKPGGKLHFTTWTDLAYNRLWAIGNEVLHEFLGNNLVSPNQGPFSLHDEKVVIDMLKTANFSKADATTVECIGQTDSAATAAQGYIFGLPIGANIQAKAPDALPGILKTIEKRLVDELGEHPLTVPQKALVFVAVK